MKFVSTFAFVTLFAASAAFAANVGDLNTMTGFITQANGTAKATTVVRVVDSYDATAQTYDTTVATIIKGKANAEAQTVAAADMYTGEQGDAIVQNCQAWFNGTIENLTLVNRTFKTCKAPTNPSSGKGFVWIGNIPFFYFKMDYVTNTNVHVDLTLTGYAFGTGKKN